MHTGPSSGAVVCILLVSSRLDCPGMGFAEVCANCLEMSMWSFSGGMALKCCKLKLHCYPIILCFMLYQRMLVLLSTKSQRVDFLQIKK